jgi:NADH:ubiquinone oxidoreductase subunit F (NADH-binding)
MTDATGGVGLPRLLAGIEHERPVALATHLSIHGPLPVQGRPKRGRPGELVDEIERAGLHGRGGAGFPTALKLHAVAAARGRGRTVVVNATEGEPASAKDETLLCTAPHLVLDGAAAAARAVSAGEVILCVAEDDSPALQAARQAIAERRSLDAEVPLSLRAVPDTYVAGQESALVGYLNGAAAKPTFTPPMIFERGVSGRPTLLSNAETFAHVALIARHGAAWFRSLGTPAHPGSMLVTLGGPVAYPGVYEIEHGATLRSLIDAAGGRLEPIRAVLMGGYAGTWIDRAELDAMTLDDGWLVPRQASTGAGVVVLLGESACGVFETVRVARWLAGESAGQCGPCVHGLAAVAERLEGIAWGGEQSGAQEVTRLASVIRGRGACRHPDGTLRFIASALQVFAEEFSDHARHGRCDACGVDPALPLPDPAARLERVAG